jgi:hypothetical protein
MNQTIKTSKLEVQRGEHHLKQEQFYSVEFRWDDLPYLFQFKIYHTPSDEMFILLKEKSKLAERLKTGNIIKMKYYSDESIYPVEIKTEVSYIKKNSRPRFKGHYSAGLNILQ